MKTTLEIENVTHVVSFKLCTATRKSDLIERLKVQIQDASICGGFNLTKDEADTLVIREV